MARASSGGGAVRIPAGYGLPPGAGPEDLNNTDASTRVGRTFQPCSRKVDADNDDDQGCKEW